MHSNLQDRYCIVGVGETDYSRGSGRSTRALATEAILNAMADAGLTPKDIDGMLSYHGGRLDHLVRARLRHGHQAQLLHGLLRRRIEQRGAGRACYRRDRGWHV